MSICYDHQKWTMLTLASIAVSLTIGLLLLVNFVHGQEQRQVPRMDTIDDVLSFCRLFPGVDITEGIEKGNMSKLFTATTCEEFKDIKEHFDKLNDDIKDAFTLDELEKQKNNK